MSKDTKQTLEFNLHGKFIGFAAEDGYKLKYLRLSTGTFEHLIHLPKEMRSLLYRSLTPGVWLQVSGYQKVDFERGKVKLKAYEVVPTQPEQSMVSYNEIAKGEIAKGEIVKGEIAKKRNSPAQTILVCQKSDCCKRGGTALTKALEQELNDRGLTDQIKIKGTGCMKQCKAGPNLVMPDKTRYTKIQAKDVAAIVDRHFPETVEVAGRMDGSIAS